MPVIIELSVGNLAPSYEFELERNSADINLATAVNVLMNIRNAKTDELTGTDVVCTVSNAAEGKIQFTPVAAYFPSAGRYIGKVKINHAGTLPETLTRWINFAVSE